jgi:dUTPase
MQTQLPIKIKFYKTFPDVIPPVKNDGDEGYDLIAINDPKIKDGYIEYETGLKIEPDPRIFLSIRPRSSISKYDLVLINAPGTIDFSFRGPICVRFKLCHQAILKNNEILFSLEKPRIYKKGDRIAQIIPEWRMPKIEWQEVSKETDLAPSIRGMGGFGSTGQ